MLSVIVPVFNVENYIEKCIESILAQTYKDIEVILIDDGSSDLSPHICDVIAKSDSRIKVVHKENGGLSSARNLGIELSLGEYITFIDSDDTINPMMFETMMHVMNITNADISMCSSQILNDSGKIVSIDRFNEGVIYKNEELFSDIILPLKTAAWNKIYKRSLISEFRFPEGRVHGEDLVFFLSIITTETKLVTTQYIGYNYFKRKNTITTSGLNQKSFDEVWCKDIAVEIVANKFPLFERYSKQWKLRSRLNLIRKLLPERKYIKNYDNIISLYTNDLKQLYNEIKDILPQKTKMEYKIFIFSSKLYKYIFCK